MESKTIKEQIANPGQLILSGLLHKCFLNDEGLPKNEEFLYLLSKYEIDKLWSCDILPDRFLKAFFRNHRLILKYLDHLKSGHHSLIITLIKNHYFLQSCPDCGAFFKLTGFSLRYRLAEEKRHRSRGWESSTNESCSEYWTMTDQERFVNFHCEDIEEYDEVDGSNIELTSSDETTL